MRGYVIELTCPRCGGELQHVNEAVHASRAVGVALCTNCNVEWAVEVNLRSRSGNQNPSAPIVRTNGKGRIYA